MTIRRAWLHLEGERSHQRVVIVGETARRYRIRADGEPVRLPSRTISGDETALVPRYAVSERIVN